MVILLFALYLCVKLMSIADCIVSAITIACIYIDMLCHLVFGEIVEHRYFGEKHTILWVCAYNNPKSK